ncbi:hypothetical protein BC835DRAFT_122314 [Cytidiella melzeri]|nr:hypothetical protein BC835DRAFT_122314 [Cytidiella melzeri]
MSEGFKTVKVRSKKPRKQWQQKIKKPDPTPVTVEEDGWNERLQLWQGQPDDSAWFKPDDRPAGDKGWERQDRVDRLAEFVPFWRDNVYAAERGEVMEKYEGFLDKLYAKEESWRLVADDYGWDAPAEVGWGSAQHNADGWGQVDASGWTEAGKGEGNDVGWDVENGDDGGWGSKWWEDSYDPWAQAVVRQDDWGIAPPPVEGDRQPNSSWRHGGVGSVDKGVNSRPCVGARRPSVSAPRRKGKQRLFPQGERVVDPGLNNA